MPTVYKIRRLSDGKFSTGTSNPRWTSVGRIFANRSALLNHINYWKQGILQHDFEGDLYYMRNTEPKLLDYEIVEYELTEIKTTPLEPR